MYQINEDKSINVTRGDILLFTVSAEDNGADYVFKAGDVVRIKVYGKKNAENVVLQKDFPATAGATEVEIFLDENDTKIGKVINKPTPYWYEVELNPLSDPQTIIGYDEDGPKVFMLYPEGKDTEADKPDIKPEDMPIIDKELDLTSPRPVQNQAAARAVVQLRAAIETMVASMVSAAANTDATIAELDSEISLERNRINTVLSLPAGSTTNDARLEDICNGADGTVYKSPANAIRGQFKSIANNYVRLESRNLVNRNKVTFGSYVDYRYGTLVESEGSAYTEYIEIKPYTNYTYSVHATNRAVGQLAYYDSEKIYISGVANSGVKNYITLATPANAKYVRWTIPKDYVNMVSIAEGDVVIDYEDHYPCIPRKYIEKSVEVGVGCEYTSILRALKSTNSDTTIYVKPGVYNIVEEYNEYYKKDYFASYSGYADNADHFTRGLWLGNGRRMIGIGNVELVFDYDGDNGAVRDYFSVIANGVNVLLENVTIKVNGNCRYHIHDDFLPENGTVTFRNLVLDGKPSTPVFIGGGLGKNVAYHIDRCVFVNDENAMYDISYHGSTKNDSALSCKIDVTNCYGASGCAFRWYGKSEKVTLCKVTGSHFGNIKCIPYDVSQPHENMKLVAWNNE